MTFNQKLRQVVDAIEGNESISLHEAVELATAFAGLVIRTTAWEKGIKTAIQAKDVIIHGINAMEEDFADFRPWNPEEAAPEKAELGNILEQMEREGR